MSFKSKKDHISTEISAKISLRYTVHLSLLPSLMWLEMKISPEDTPRDNCDNTKRNDIYNYYIPFAM